MQELHTFDCRCNGMFLLANICSNLPNATQSNFVRLFYFIRLIFVLQQIFVYQMNVVIVVSCNSHIIAAI